jgi:hypothetical protein
MKQSTYPPFHNLPPHSSWVVPENLIDKESAEKLGMVGMTIGCQPNEYWILHNIVQDCRRAGLNYCFVKGQQGTELWKQVRQIKQRNK